MDELGGLTGVSKADFVSSQVSNVLFRTENAGREDIVEVDRVPSNDVPPLASGETGGTDVGSDTGWVKGVETKEEAVFRLIDAGRIDGELGISFVP